MFIKNWFSHFRIDIILTIRKLRKKRNIGYNSNSDNYLNKLLLFYLHRNETNETKKTTKLIIEINHILRVKYVLLFKKIKEIELNKKKKEFQSTHRI